MDGEQDGVFKLFSLLGSYGFMYCNVRISHYDRKHLSNMSCGQILGFLSVLLLVYREIQTLLNNLYPTVQTLKQK